MSSEVHPSKAALIWTSLEVLGSSDIFGPDVLPQGPHP